MPSPIVTRTAKATVSGGFGYYPFGMMQEGRQFVGGMGYRWGFGGNDGLKCSNSISIVLFDYRTYNCLLGRWLGVDPLTNQTPFESPYSYVANNPNVYIDIEGKTKYLIINILNETTGVSTTVIFVVNSSELIRTKVWHTSSTNSHSEYYNIGWRDINIIYDITLRDNGETTRVLRQTVGAIRFEQHPFWDLLGIYDTQDKVNQKLKNPGWGGVHWVSNNSKSKETRKSQSGDLSVKTENIDLLMTVLTSISPNDFNIPDIYLNNSSTLQLLNILSQSMDRQASTIDISVNAVQETKKKINTWKNDNLVKKCKHGWIYNNDGTVNNRKGVVPKDKKLSRDSHDCGT
jgi:RHS repeat-associated protein